MDCIVCCEPMEYCARYPCSHAICYKCATKLLILYDDKACPLCKSSAGKPTFELVETRGSECESENEIVCSDCKNEAGIGGSSNKTNSIAIKRRAAKSKKGLAADDENKAAGAPKNEEAGAAKTGPAHGSKAASKKNDAYRDSLARGITHKNAPAADKNSADEEVDGNGKAEINIESFSTITMKPLIEDEHAFYASPAMHDRIKGLLLKKCRRCKLTFENNQKLAEHYKKAHQGLLCTVCLDHNHQFWFEVASYTPETLGMHKNGALQEPGFAGHVLCVHCSIYLFGREEAKKHCHAEHQLCTVCDVLGLKYQFYRNYADLEEHYRSQHYCCTNAQCVKNLCYVYAYKSELWTHCLTHHGLDIQPGDIVRGSRANPPVCSFGMSEDAAENNMYQQLVNIVNPLVNEPYFPSFKKKSEETAVPEFMDREIIAQEQCINNIRIRQIKSICKAFSNEINTSIEKYIEGSKTLPVMVEEIEASVGKQMCLRLLENISFMHRMKEVKDFLKEYKKSVMFPTFTKGAKPEWVNKKAKPVKGPFSEFKILDTTSRK